MKEYHPLNITAHPASTMISSTGIASLDSGDSTSTSQRIPPDHATGIPNVPTQRYILFGDSAISLPLVKPHCVKQHKVASVGTTSTAKKNMKPKDPKRDTSVSFDEMKRLMRVYGPIKVLRNRVPKGNEQSVKPESIRRKFYRWFPDFGERFVKTPEGWYVPKAGHQQEMEYREAMRKMDGEVLAKKRGATKRSNTSARKGTL